MDENSEERRKTSRNINEGDDLARRPLQRVGPPKNTENELHELNQSSNLDNSKNGAMDDNREHKIPKQNQEILSKNDKKGLKKSRNGNKALIRKADGNCTETLPAFTAGINEAGTEQRFTIEPQRSYYMRSSCTEQWEEVCTNDTHGDENMEETIQSKRPPVVMKRGMRRVSQEIYISDTSSKDCWKIITAFLCGVFAVILYYILLLHSTNTEVLNLNVTSIVSQLEPDFQGQPKMSFTVIRSALKAVSEPGFSKTSLLKSADTSEPDAPAIILLLAAKGAEELTARLGRNLAKAVSPSHLHIQGADYAHQDSNFGKKKMDDYLKTLNNKGYDAVLVEDLHRIPGSIALMLHTYCDHENAPYKRVVYVMTVASESKIPKNSMGKFWDETVRIRLSKSWSDIDNDQMEPLLTRLTVGVAAIIEDSN